MFGSNFEPICELPCLIGIHFTIFKTYYKEFLSNTNSLPDYLKGKESIVFGNLEEIYNFHKKYSIPVI